MNADPNFDCLLEAGTFDPIGTVRISQMLGIVSVYIKVDEDSWLPVYVDPARVEHLVPQRRFGDRMASSYPIMFSPKPVA